MSWSKDHTDISLQTLTIWSLLLSYRFIWFLTGYLQHSMQGGFLQSDTDFLYSLSVTAQAEHLFLLHVLAIKICWLSLCRNNRSDWKPLSVQVSSEKIQAQTQGHSWSCLHLQAELREGQHCCWEYLEISKFSISIQNKIWRSPDSLPLSFPACLPPPDALAPGEDQKAPFLLARSILHLNWLTLQLAKKRRKVLASCFGVPCFILAHGCTLPPRGTPALLGPQSPPGEHPWLSGIWHAPFKAAWWYRVFLTSWHF